MRGKKNKTLSTPRMKGMNSNPQAPGMETQAPGLEITEVIKDQLTGVVLIRITQAQGMETMRVNTGQIFGVNVRTSQSPGAKYPMRSREAKRNTIRPSQPSEVWRRDRP